MAGVHQILVRLLDGDTRCLLHPSPSLSGRALKLRLHALTGVPPDSQLLLVSSSRVLHDETLIHASDGSFPSFSLLLRLRGGKGGFGSLLRGAATKAGQKKTNNFDACRDMSGRRLRHVNAERRLEEWKAEAEERRLERVAEEFLRKKAKEARRKDGREVEKYVERCKEVSERCMGEVEESVRSSFGLYEEGKRKALPAVGTASKRLKIWLGKNKIDESDSEDDEDDESDSEDEKSMVVDGGNQKDEAGSSGTASGGHSDGEFSGGGSEGSNREEENICSDENRTLEEGKGLGSGDSNIDSDDSAETKDTVYENPSSERFTFESERSADNNNVPIHEGPATSEMLLQEQLKAQMPSTCTPENLVTSQKEEINDGSSGILNEVTGRTATVSSGILNEITTTTVLETLTLRNTIESASQPDPIVHVGTTCQSPVSSSEEPLNFDKFSSASELEALGMEQLKVELQANGLKCGGTLQERAARLFLLKTTPLDKLPKNVLAKRPGGGK